MTTNHSALKLFTAFTMLAALLSLIVLSFLHGSQPSFAASDQNTLSELRTSAISISTSSDALVAATSTGRSYLEIQNMGATTSVPVYCSIGGATSTAYSGFVIAPTSTRVFDLDALYRGAIRCVSTGSPTTLFVLEN